jgi:hypothetical protein
MVERLFGSYALQSTVIGDLAPGKLRWLQHHTGTIDGLHIFGSDGRLYQAKVHGVASEPLPPGQKCWPSKDGRTVVRFQGTSPSYTEIVRIGYVWFSSAPDYVSVSYPGGIQDVRVKPGLHSAFVFVTGSVDQLTVQARGGGLCIGDAQAGNLGPDHAGFILPAPLS